MTRSPTQARSEPAHDASEPVHDASEPVHDASETAQDVSPTAQDGAGGRNGVQAIDRAVSILLCFDARSPTLGISEIARRTGLSTTTTHRLLAALQANRLVRQTADRRYGLGPLLVQLARNGALPTALREVALPHMAALRDEVDETVGLHELLPTGERVVVDQMESRQTLRRTYTDIGKPLPLPHGAPGKAILSVLPVELQDRWLSGGIPQVTPATITDVAALRADLALTRRRGWALSVSERTPGISAVAAPVFDSTGAVVGALGLSVPELRMGPERRELLGMRVQQAAWAVSEALGATPALVEQAVERAGGRHSDGTGGPG